MIKWAYFISVKLIKKFINIIFKIGSRFDSDQGERARWHQDSQARRHRPEKLEGGEGPHLQLGNLTIITFYSSMTPCLNSN